MQGRDEVWEGKQHEKSRRKLGKTYFPVYTIQQNTGKEFVKHRGETWEVPPCSKTLISEHSAASGAVDIMILKRSLAAAKSQCRLLSLRLTFTQKRSMPYVKFKRGSQSLFLKNPLGME